MLTVKNYLYVIPVIAFLASVPAWSSQFLIDALVIYLLYLSAAEVWGFMAKNAGLVSLGQQIFIGVGGYTTAVITMYYGVAMWSSVLISSLIGAGLAAVLAFPLLRMRGMYFSISTFLAAEVIKLFFNSWEFVGAGKGLIFREAYGVSTSITYYAALAVAISTVFLLYYLYNLKIGFGLRSVGCDEDAASSVGVNTFRLKALMFIIASAIISVIGAINAVNRTYLHPTSAFSIAWTVDFVFIAVIGGMGRLMGPVMGCAIFLTLRYMFAQYLGLSLLLEGIVVFALLLASPEGLWGLISRRIKIKPPPPI
ncbi:MAG: branched-chain amino acid ABC transporter permease [Candidatus Caldarchaeum sp.]|nr:branched-chain amino acid ABC transporter permease [Candidatus Caldarchaeum sp.]MDW7977905.1 branched-chain amino acid ABC transporter permease [Candidatus Caldarchaeum sp.]MDW8359549.1 branched-chain amino acid ABC transporter permease [Candidatus Caldarchaeum sp.]